MPWTSAQAGPSGAIAPVGPSYPHPPAARTSYSSAPPTANSTPSTPKLGASSGASPQATNSPPLPPSPTAPSTLAPSTTPSTAWMHPPATCVGASRPMAPSHPRPPSAMAWSISDRTIATCMHYLLEPARTAIGRSLAPAPNRHPGGVGAPNRRPGGIGAPSPRLGGVSGTYRSR